MTTKSTVTIALEWREKDTLPSIDKLKVITADLLDGYDRAVDKAAYLHQQIHLRIRKTQRLPYMTRAAWTQEDIETRNPAATSTSSTYPHNAGTTDWGRKSSTTTSSLTPATKLPSSSHRRTRPTFWH